MALTEKQQEWIEQMRKQQAEGEARRLAQLAARTPEQIAHEEAVRQQQIATAEKRNKPIQMRKRTIRIYDEDED